MTVTTRGTRKRLSQSPPPSTPPANKTRVIDHDSSKDVNGQAVNVEDFMDVEAEDGSDAGDDAGADEEHDDEKDSSNEWVVSDGVDPSVYDSDEQSDVAEDPEPLTGSRDQSDSEEYGAQDLVHIAKINVKGKSKAVSVPVGDKTDVAMSDADGQGVDSDNEGNDEGAQDPDDDTRMQDVSGGAAANTATGGVADDGIPGIISRAGSMSLVDPESKGDGKVVTDLSAAAEEHRAVTAPKKSDAKGKPKPTGKNKATDDKPKTVKQQTKLELEKKDEIALEEPFIRDDGKPVAGKILRRFVIFTTFANDQEAMYYVRNEPSNLRWSAKKVGISRLVAEGQATCVRYMCIGQVSWNGMLPVRGEGGTSEYPTRPKISIKCLRDRDFLHCRNIIKEYSNSQNQIEVQNMSSLSAYTDSGERQRGSEKITGVAFPEIYDGEKKYSANKQGMEKLRPSDLMRDDIVMLEFSVGRYYDIVGKPPNWTSTRAYFRLEAVSLLLRGDRQVNESTKKSDKKQKIDRNARMDASI
ncbi:unnamed protein product [Peniophora sp. CBMAI 1063]|nr:unnamed protein product [Peniophora sp. CBMAI 1063]